MNEIPFFLGQWSVPDCQPINRQLSMYTDTVHVLAQHYVSTSFHGNCGRSTELLFCLRNIVGVQFDSDVHLVDCLWNKTNMQNKNPTNSF